MKVFQINVTSNWGSTGRIVEEIGKTIIFDGGESYIAGGRNIRKSSSTIIRVGSKYDIYFHVLQTRLFDKHGLASVKATRKLIKQIDKISPDIIHLHNIHGYYLNYKILFDFLSHKQYPVVWTLHDCWTFTGHCSYYSFVGCERWKTECFDCCQKKNYPSSLFVDRSGKNYRDKKNSFSSVKNMILVPVSNWLANEVKESFLNNYPMQVIYNGLDLNSFFPQNTAKVKYGVENRFVILGVASVWSQRKGLDDFIKLSHYLNKDEIIILVGLSTAQIKKMPRNIIGIPRTESIHQLAELYSIADVYVNPSVEETFGLTVAESLSCGTPAIVYNSTACVEIISEDTGFAVDSHDINAILNAIILVKKRGKSYYFQFCRDRVVRLFDNKERYAEYIQLYKEILNIK